MRRQAIGLAVLTMALVTPAWGQDPEDEKLIGKWGLAKVEYMQNAVDVPEGQLSFTFAKGGKLTLQKAAAPAEDGSYKLGAAKTPREIDITGPSSDGKKKETTKAIYQFDGDTFKMAFPFKGPDGERPTAFDPKAVGIMTFKRLKN